MTIDAAQRCQWCGRPAGSGSLDWLRCGECGTVACSECLDHRRAAQAAWGEADAAQRCVCGAAEFEMLDQA